MTPSRLTETQSAEITTDRAATINLPLAKRVRSGVGWNVSSSLIEQLIGFVRSVVLARILAPEDFGLFGMALTIVAALNALTTIGLNQTIVANKFETKDELKAHLDTVWSAELIRSLVVALLVAASAFPMSRFYGQAQLSVIIPILGLITLVQGFQNIGLVILRKEISFARIFWYELATNVAGIALTVALAVVMRNVWALAMPGHQILRQLCNINRLGLVSVRGAIFSAFCALLVPSETSNTASVKTPKRLRWMVRSTRDAKINAASPPLVNIEQRSARSTLVLRKVFIIGLRVEADRSRFDRLVFAYS